nr:PREDICTED: pleckstrin homology domain-containing family G member 7 [Lepisosteus oculatus]
MQQPAGEIENAQDFDEEPGWTLCLWQDPNEGSAGRSSAQTQTSPVLTEDKETQTCNPVVMRLASSKLKSTIPVEEDNRALTPLFQFDRQAPARISTSPTLRRMRRSIRRPPLDFSDPGKTNSTKAETPLGLVPHSKSSDSITHLIIPRSPAYRQKSPLAHSLPSSLGFAAGFTEDHESGLSPSSDSSDGLSTGGLGNGLVCRNPESQAVRESSSRKGDIADDSNEVNEPIQKRLQERRRSSVVVSLPGLDMSPGDLFVSDGAADYLSRSSLLDTKKSKWPFSKRGATKDKMKLVPDMEKYLSKLQIQDWSDSEFQKYKDWTLAEFLSLLLQCDLKASDSHPDYRKEEAVWELFTSECVYFLDQLMVLKEVFLSTLTGLQNSDYLFDVDPWRLFANLNELCLVSFGFLTNLLRAINESWESGDKKSSSLNNLLTKVFKESICYCQQKYCLNYSSAVFYLDSLKQREDFGTYLKWCERNEQCKRLHLADLLVAPMQRFTRYPLLLKNIAKQSSSDRERGTIQSVVELVERSIQDLEGKVKWLDSYQKLQQLKDSIIWPPVWEQNKRAFIPENLKYLLKPVTPENLVANRNLLHEGKLVLTENAKLQDVYLFLFDEFLLITKIKRSKKKSVGTDINTLCPSANQEFQSIFKEGGTFTVLDQPMSLDRLLIKNVDQLNATASGLRNPFILMHQNRYQQCTGAFILQAQSEASKKTWISKIEEAVAAVARSVAKEAHVRSSSFWLESSQI